MKSRRYFVYDVFTDTVLAGNPLGVVMDCAGLDDAAMQAIAREFNLSRIRLHPAARQSAPSRPGAHLHARLRNALRRPSDRRLGDRVGRAGGRGSRRRHVRAGGEDRPGALRRHHRTRRDLRRIRPAETARATRPCRRPGSPGRGTRLSRRTRSASRITVQAWSAGVPYVTLPVASLDGAARARLDNDLWMQLAPPGARASSPRPMSTAATRCITTARLPARMFVPGNPSYEDPATGFRRRGLPFFSGAILHLDRPVDGRAALLDRAGDRDGSPFAHPARDRRRRRPHGPRPHPAATR